MSRTLRVGARGSRLSLWQVHHAIETLQRRGVAADLVVLSSSGDRDRRAAIEDLPSAAPFADDLEDGLNTGAIDVAVHSLKDLALVPPAGLVVSALLPRGSVTESLVSGNHIPIARLRPGSVIGTCSSRRQAQVHLRRPDLVCRPIRGPVDDRVEQVRSGEFAAAILATAGLERLGLSEAITETFSASDFVPAAGQGALALQVREADAEARALTAGLDHFATRLATTAELAAQRRLESAGQLAAAYAFVQHAFITLQVRVLSRDGSDVVDVMASGTDPNRVALEASDRALDRKGGSAMTASAIAAPLSGITVLVTRPRASALSRVFRRAGARVVWRAAIRIGENMATPALDAALRGVGGFEWIVFTSVHGVSAFWRRARALRIDPEVIRAAKFAAVGPATTRAIERHGARVSVIADPHSAEGLLVQMAYRLEGGSTVLYPRAAGARPILVDGLRRLGARVTEATANETTRSPSVTELPAILEAGVDCVVFCSPSAVRAVLPYRALIARSVIACIMLKAAAANGWIDEATAVDETLTAIKRAGADVIITYFAVDAARRLAHVHS